MVVPTRARRRAGTGAAVVALAAALVGCGNTPPPPAPALGQVPATTFTGGPAEFDVCSELKFTADLKFSVILLGRGEPLSPQSAEQQLQIDLADYAEDVRAVVPRTVDPVLRPVLDNALAAAEGAAEVTSLDELRRTPFKAAAVDLRRVCEDVLGRADADEPEPEPIASSEVGPVCDLPVTFEVPEGWQPEAASDDGDYDDGAVGPFSKKCDITLTSPVSVPGSLSVATAPGSAGDPSKALLAYLADARASGSYDEVHRPTLTARRAAGGLPAAEAYFLMERDGETIVVWACAVAVPDGLVLVRFNAHNGQGRSEIEAGYRFVLQTLRLP